MPVQVLNSEQIGLLEAHFQPRNEPNFAWKSACSAFLALPALRAFWPMSAVDYAAATQARDIAGSGYHLTNNNSADFGYDDLAPYVEFNGTTQYLSRASAVGNWATITGTEAFIVAAQRGLTLGGWFWIDQTTGANQNLMAKTTGVGANRSYFLSYTNATTFPNFTICLGGGASDQVDGTAGTTGAVTFNTWYFWCGRFTPGAELKIWLNDNSNTNVAAIPASINDTGAPFTIGANGVPGIYQDGKASMCFLCAAALSDAAVSMLYHWTRAMYGV